MHSPQSRAGEGPAQSAGEWQGPRRATVAAPRRMWTHSTTTMRLSAMEASSLLPWPSSWGSLSSSAKDSAVGAKRSTGKSMVTICNDGVSCVPAAGGTLGSLS
ncbi:unnamed protein product [Gulo gulo]|uniref:Uncharacterized protein n=1 Tax=Gulo gulo TaxID=48420 RepID=A0A9X9PSY9_GULGU|nr:unnamed protein product [Gulo gulo]